MSVISTTFQIVLLIIIVLMIFNIIIFVHELGHFLAAKWRGLRIDRFQIWFGTPIWKKEYNGVQYGLGWIPAGGFVALPQMAPMEALEGGNKDGKPLPPITPLDKIIVAFAGPLFSMLLALLSAVVVWGVGKPKDFIPSQIVGEVVEGSPAAQAGILPGPVSRGGMLAMRSVGEGASPWLRKSRRSKGVSAPGSLNRSQVRRRQIASPASQTRPARMVMLRPCDSAK